MIYAPVIIPTLNRFEHFCKCLESLEACTGAEHTDVYVALDYPPSEKYVDGWKKIDAYLHKKESNHKFNTLTVYRRKVNYFFSGKGNGKTAIEDLPSEIDRYIFSEDDNVFSPNFLEYINKGLEKFNDDPNVLYICGYTQPYDFKYGNNTYFFHRTDFSAWGYGTWKNKDKIVKAAIKDRCFPYTFSIANYFKVRKHGLNRLQQYMSYVLQRYGKDVQIRYTDCMITSYIIINNKYVINPVISKVRNIGWDSTGCSFMGRENILEKLKDISQRHMAQVIDESAHFDYLGDPTYMMRYNDNLAASVSEGQISWYTYVRSLLFMLLRFVMRKIFGKRFMNELKKYI